MKDDIKKVKVIECNSEEELSDLISAITGILPCEDDCYGCEGDYEVMKENGMALGRFIARVIGKHYYMEDDFEGMCMFSDGFSRLCNITDSEPSASMILSVLRGFHMYPIALYLEELLDCNDEQFADCFVCTLNSFITEMIEGVEKYGESNFNM